MINDIFEVRKTYNNMKNHDYTVGDYKVCKKEAELVMELLERQLLDLTFDEQMKEPII